MTTTGGGEFPLADLRRFPDVEAANLHAVDATDRLLLREAEPQLSAVTDGQLTIIGDRFGALTLGISAACGLSGIRVFSDAVTGERALDANAERTGLTGRYRHCELDADLLSDAHLVLVQLPRGLAELREIADLIARHANPAVTVLLGGRIKHMTTSMNAVLGEYFDTVQARRAHQKSRVLVATGPLRPTGPPPFPIRRWDVSLELTVCAFGGTFGGTTLDAGTERLLAHIGELPPAERIIDLGCGSGVIAAAVARQRPAATVLATDRSAAAVASARATAEANGLADRILVERDDALATAAPESADLILCNPPFHLDASVHAGAGLKLFAAAGRVLRPGGQLWTVYNSHLGHRNALTQLVGVTRIVERGRRFTVTASVKR